MYGILVPIENLELKHLLDTLTYLAILPLTDFLLDHVGEPNVLDLAVHLVIFLAKLEGGSSQDNLTNSTFLLEHSFMLKSYRVWWVMVANVILLSALDPIGLIGFGIALVL